MRVSTTSIGRQAETAAVNYLQSHGFEVLERNFRTRDCEIDIIARKDGVLYFTEVKYRRNDQQGSGLEYITPRKLSQMTYAAQVWLQQHDDSDYRLAGIEVSGNDFRISEFIDSLT